MAFCNSCGASLAPDAKFCNKCGATITGAPAATNAPPPAPTGGSSALKIVLIIVGIIVVLGIVGVATVGIIGYHIARSAHVTQNGHHVKVETPFGNVETSNNPEQTARDLGIDIYPGAQVQKNGAATATFGAMRTVSANFETSDSPDKVCAFYKSKFPNPMVTTSDQNRCTIISNDKQNTVTITVEVSGDHTKLQITSVTKKGSSPN